MRARAIASLPLLLACGGCAGWQSALDPQGPAARALGGLLQGFTLVLAGIWLVVLLVLAAALWRRPAVAQGQARRRSAIAVGAACAGTVLVVSGLTLASYMTTLAISAPGEEPLVIRVRGLQWWWEVTYPDASGQELVTANEIHIPVGRPVRIELSSADVIHSFWVPNLAGKQDMIPGRDNVLTIQAGAAGVHRGQCAEFCGLQHARMAFMVIAEPPEDFARWRAAQLADAAPPAGEEEALGRQVFEQTPCGACHTVRGTTARGTNGPDLTHLASRAYLAAGVLPMTRGALAAWIADPQTIKPGNNMPMVPLAAGELQAVSAWLAGLR
jgi:cytochrome c oxidase subunit 2